MALPFQHPTARTACYAEIREQGVQRPEFRCRLHTQIVDGARSQEYLFLDHAPLCGLRFELGLQFRLFEFGEFPPREFYPATEVIDPSLRLAFRDLQLGYDTRVSAERQRRASRVLPCRALLRKDQAGRRCLAFQFLRPLAPSGAGRWSHRRILSRRVRSAEFHCSPFFLRFNARSLYAAEPFTAWP